MSGKMNGKMSDFVWPSASVFECGGCAHNVPSVGPERSRSSTYRFDEVVVMKSF